MIPMVLADKILDMSAEELADILRHIENMNLYLTH